MNDDNHLDDRLQMLRDAVSSTPSLLDDVMRRIGDSPPAVRRRSRRRPITLACLATAACALVFVVAWMAIDGDDSARTASIDGMQDAVQLARKDESKATNAYDSKLLEADSNGDTHSLAERSRGREQSHASRTLGVRRERREFGAGGVARDKLAAEPFSATLRKASRSEPQPKLSDFTGLWHGTAVDKPEDGTAEDPLGIKLTLSRDGQLEGFAFGRFVGDDEARLEDLYVVGNRLEFKVRHRTGVQMRVTLGLVGEKLKGDGIPIRSDQSRCDVVLQRRRPKITPREAGPTKR